MSDDRETWQTLQVPGGGPSFRYPSTTPSGQPVNVDDVRVHLQSLDGAELYFEVSRHLGASAQATYEQERAFVAERLGADVGPLVETTCAGHRALEFSFAWAEKRRTIILIERDAWLIRVVYDPTSALDMAVLETLALG